MKAFRIKKAEVRRSVLVLDHRARLTPPKIKCVLVRKVHKLPEPRQFVYKST